MKQSTPTDAGPEVLRAASYTRVSTDDQAREGHSLADQDAQAHALIAREDWTHAETYQDAGVSGVKRSRPALDRMIEHIAAGRIDVVIVSALDRLSRDAGHLRELLLLFDAAGVRVHASGQALDRRTPEGKLHSGILGEFAEFERAKIRERTKIGMNASAKKKPWGSQAAYGYTKTTFGWEPVPGEREVFRRVHGAFTREGQSASAIAKALTLEPHRHQQDAEGPLRPGGVPPRRRVASPSRDA